MTDLHLIDFLIRAQKDARRCYGIYVQAAKHWANYPYEAGALSDVIIWQNRASLAAEHVQRLHEICYPTR